MQYFVTFGEEGGGETDDLLPKMEKSVLFPFGWLFLFGEGGGKTDRFFLTKKTTWPFSSDGVGWREMRVGGGTLGVKRNQHVKHR